MTVTELHEKLKSEVSTEELELIKAGQMAHLSIPNARTIIEMMEKDISSDEYVSESDVEKLREITNDYLAQYFAEHPEAWKWIFICCAYNAFVLRIPMHPQEWVKYTSKVVDGRTIYYCPAKTHEPNTNCSFCPCEFADQQ